MKRLSYLFACMVLQVGLGNSAWSQTNEGTDFWMGFMEHFDVQDNQKVLMLMATQKTQVQVEAPGINWQRSLSVDAGEVSILNLPQAIEQVGQGIAKLGVHVTANHPISVYAHQYANFRSEAAVILPTSSLGNLYRVMSFRGFRNQRGDIFPSQMMIIGAEDSTLISFTPNATTTSGAAGIPQTYLIDKGETLQIQALSEAGDLSGTLVEGNRPFCLMSGAKWTEVPNGCAARDNLLEQMYPVNSWGRRFALASFAKVSYDVIRVMAHEDRTLIFQDGSLAEQLNAGEFWEFQLPGDRSTYIEADKPIQVAQFIVGNACNSVATGDNGDPSMVIINPIEQTRKSMTIYSSAFEVITENYLNLVIRSQDSATIRLDGQPVEGFQPFQFKTELALARIPVNAGIHQLESEGCGIIATAYGYGQVESYAYAGGANLQPINAYSLPDGGCLNDTVYFGEGLDPTRYDAIWDFGDGSGSTLLQPTHIYNRLGNYLVQLVLIDRCLDLRDTLEKEILISLRQDLSIRPDTSICTGESVTLYADDLPGADYEWTLPSGLIAIEQQFQITDAQKLDSGLYAARGIISGCATFPQFMWLDVRPTPFPYLGPDQKVCGSGPFELIPPVGFSTYTWGDGSQETSYKATMPGTYSVKVTDDLGCEGEDEITLVEACPPKVWVPSAFSPNGDGINDAFDISVDFVESFHFHIFDRWGAKVFTSQNPAQSWQGILPNGSLAREGVYIWHISYVISTQEGIPFTRQETGTLTLFR